ncbi:MAG: class I SAM-dependent methyltransferase [Actinomycetota bacterium]
MTRPVTPMEEIRRFWDVDSATYDDAPNHRPRSAAERAAWSAALARHLPSPPARVLDVGAGTGFLTLGAARLGHRVTALDLSGGMLARLRTAAAAEGLAIEAVEGRAEEPPPGPFDAVMERHLLWTLADPVAALATWRSVAPAGRLILFESLWGRADPVETLRGRARDLVRRLGRRGRDHHASYSSAVLAELPLSSGTPPRAVVEVVEAAGWPAARLERLRDVEWAAALELAPLERALGVAARFLVSAG